jgi:hypothetical protein
MVALLWQFRPIVTVVRPGFSVSMKSMGTSFSPNRALPGLRFVPRVRETPWAELCLIFVFRALLVL